MRWPFGAVSVAGPSMAPTLLHGDAVIVWRGWAERGPRVRPGDIVVGRFPAGPDRLVVKRAVRPLGADSTPARNDDVGWWLEGDNPGMSDDSRTYGPADVSARVVWRYWPLRRPRPGGRAGRRMARGG